MEFDVIGLGTVVMDHQLFMPSLPGPDRKVDITSQRGQVGGAIPTALVQIARWGRRCRFAGKWGADDYGRQIRQDLEAEGLDLSTTVTAAEGHSGFAHVWVSQSTGERAIALSRGGFEAPSTDDIDPRRLVEGQILHLDGWAAGLAIAAARSQRERGGRVTLDAGSPKPMMEQLIPYVDVMNCPEDFAQQFLGIHDHDEAAIRLLDLGARAVIFTRGSRGATAYSAEGVVHQPAFSVEVVDSTGAGDVFCGGLLDGLLDKCSLGESLARGAAAAALKCTVVGNRSALPARDEVLALASTA